MDATEAGPAPADAAPDAGTNGGARGFAPDPAPAPAAPAIPSDELTTEQALDFLIHGTPPPEVGSTSRQRELLQRIVEAASVADLLTEQTFRTAADLQYQPLVVNGYTWRLGQLRDDGPPFYALVDLTIESSGIRELISVDDETAMVQLIRATEQGWLPLRCQLEPGTTDYPAGHRQLWLKQTMVPPPAPSDQGALAPRL